MRNSQALWTRKDARLGSFAGTLVGPMKTMRIRRKPTGTQVPSGSYLRKPS